MLQATTRDAFVRAVLADLPETPPYFARMKRVNQQGRTAARPLRARGASCQRIRPAAAAALAADGALIIDLRTNDVVRAGPPRRRDECGASARKSATGPAGWCRRIRRSFCSQRIRQRRSEARCSCSASASTASRAGSRAALAAGRAPAFRSARIERLSAANLRAQLNAQGRLTVLDVRTSKEWTADHIPGSVNIPLGSLPARVDELDARPPVATICEGGYRSALAASLLAREGFATDHQCGWRHGSVPRVGDHLGPCR